MTAARSQARLNLCSPRPPEQLSVFKSQRLTVLRFEDLNLETETLRLLKVRRLRDALSGRRDEIQRIGYRRC